MGWNRIVHGHLSTHYVEYEVLGNLTSLCHYISNLARDLFAYLLGGRGLGGVSIFRLY